VRLRLGNSNTLHRLLRRRGESEECFLVRQFGQSSAFALNRARENQQFGKLAEFGIAPPLIATFHGGRIEGWLDGQACTAVECRTPAVSGAVARALAALHALPPDSIDTHLDEDAIVKAGESWAWVAARTWMHGAGMCIEHLECLASADEALVARVRNIDLGEIENQLNALESHLGRHPELTSLCFCHNDLSNTNVLRDASRGTTHLIDFEFGGINMRGFDLATHMSHWAGGAVDGLYDDKAFPTEAEQGLFLGEYARAAAAINPAEARGGGLLQQLQVEVTATKPLVHCVWGLWALCALPGAIIAEEPSSFSHIEYAERRLAAFEASLPSAMALSPPVAPPASSQPASLKVAPESRHGRLVADMFHPDALGGGRTEGTRW